MGSRWTALRVARARRGLTQRDLADLAGMTESKVAKLETLRQRPTPDELRRIAYAVGEAAEELDVSEATCGGRTLDVGAFATEIRGS